MVDGRKIIHIDMDAFYASVEQRDFPHLRGQPVVVGGKPGSRGVVAAASYEARRFGIHSAMPATRAHKLCPHAVFVRARFDVYRAVSAQIREIFYRYTDLVEPLSLDEAYLDVTENKTGNPSATLIANEIRGRIREKTGLTASAGVAPNKLIAKVASDVNKPDGICVIPPERVLAFVEKLPIGKFYGVGKAGGYYYQIARGRDHRRVTPDRERKSVGVEETFAEDLTHFEAMERILGTLAHELERRLDKHKMRGKTVTLKLRYANFETITRATTLDDHVGQADRLFQVARHHLHQSQAEQRGVRLLGITVSNLEERDKIREVQLWLPFGEGETF